MSEQSTAPDLAPVKHSFPGTTSEHAAILGSAEERFPQKQAHVCQSWWNTHQSIALALNNIQWLRQLLSQPCGSGFWRLLISSTRALHLLLDKHCNSIESRRCSMLMSRRSKRPIKISQKYVTTRLSAAHLMGTHSPGFPLTIRHSFKSSADKQMCTRSRRTRGVRALITIFTWTFFPPFLLHLVQIKYRDLVPRQCNQLLPKS